jgi:hypothetical protein
MSISATEPALRFVAFQVVASTPDGAPVYSIADIIEPLPQYNRHLLRSARLTAGPRGYVLAGRPNLPWDEFQNTARRIDGLYSKPGRNAFA